MTRVRGKCGVALIVAVILAVVGSAGQESLADRRHDPGQRTLKAGLTQSGSQKAGSPKGGQLAGSADTQAGSGRSARSVLGEQADVRFDSSRAGIGQAFGQSHALARAQDTSKAGSQIQPTRPSAPFLAFPDMWIRWLMAAGAIVLLGPLLLMLNALRRQADAGDGAEMQRGESPGRQG